VPAEGEWRGRVEWELEGGESVVGGVGGESSAVSVIVTGKGEWADQLECK
jgi:hypothetical protein